LPVYNSLNNNSVTNLSNININNELINIQNKGISNSMRQELNKERINAMDVQHRMDILEKRVQSPRHSVQNDLNGNGGYSKN